MSSVATLADAGKRGRDERGVATDVTRRGGGARGRRFRHS